MYRKFQPFFIIAETPLHPGSGSELGIIDLPIQRERYTDFPKIEGSGLKGCIREAFESLRIIENKESKLLSNEITKRLKEKFSGIEEQWKQNNEVLKDKEGNSLTKFDQAVQLTFGPEEGDAHAGAIAFTDARILLFPVKSLKGVFAWITCPMVLEKFKEDMRISGTILSGFSPDIATLENTVCESSNITISSKVVLEEYAFEVKPDDNTNKIAQWFSNNIFPGNDTYKYWREKMLKDIVILSDDDFREFVKTSTEVITRTRISSDTGTVQPGALWTEEYLPQETILYSTAMASPIRLADDGRKGILKGDTPDKEAENVISFFTQGLPEIIQIGGNQTIGKGIARIKLF